MIGDELRSRGMKVVLDSRRRLRSRGERRPGGEVRASGSTATVAEQVTAAVQGVAPAAFITEDGTTWILDEVAASDVVYAGVGAPNEAQAAVIEILLPLLDGDATPERAARRKRTVKAKDSVPAEEEPVTDAPAEPEDASAEEEAAGE